MQLYKPKNIINNINEYDLSILIPMYNSKNYIEKCISSIVKNISKYKVEIIIVNDGSSDDSLTILQNYIKNVKTDYSIKIIDQQNHGISFTRNVLLENAKGEFISFIDSDDYVSYNFIEKMLNDAKKSGADYVKCNYSKVSIENVVLFKSKYCINSQFTDLDCYLWGSIIKKDLYKDINFPDGYWFEDMINKLLVLPKVKKFIVETENLYYYTEHNNSATQIQGKKKNLKNSDQYYLTKSILIYLNETNKMSLYLYKAILNEYGMMMWSRTRKLPLKTKYKLFNLACDDLRPLLKKYKVKNCYEIIFKTRLFFVYNIMSFLKKFLNKIRY